MFAVVTGFVVENNPEHDVVSLSFINHVPINPCYTIGRSKPETICVIEFDGDNSVQGKLQPSQSFSAPIININADAVCDCFVVDTSRARKA